jgi:hypothetical protein
MLFAMKQLLLLLNEVIYTCQFLPLRGILLNNGHFIASEQASILHNGAQLITITDYYEICGDFEDFCHQK